VSAVTVTVVGGGLAGCEAALLLAERGHRVRLVEMRPVRQTPAHETDRLGELVCTNSFKSEDPANAHGQLKREMRALGSHLLRAADLTRVPAGSALAVDRHLFSEAMTAAVRAHPGIDVVRDEATRLPVGPAVVATGPLTSDALSAAIQERVGTDSLAFFDAIAPIVHGDSLDREVVFRAGRFGEDGDYLNCPMSREEYATFIQALKAADIYPGNDWERVPFFEGCLPIEVMAARGDDTLRFGPMKPIGLVDPRTGRRPWAVVQLRAEDRAGQMWNLVGFQTRLRTGEQGRVFRLIPGPRGGGVPPVGLHPPEQLPELPRLPGPPWRAPGSPGAGLRRTDHRRRGVHRVGSLGAPCGVEPGPDPPGEGAGPAAPHHDDGRAVPLPPGV
jgi:methylenetetrahydrofolate--tRNA-(uracil-5-)-methyltransferase